MKSRHIAWLLIVAIPLALGGTFACLGARRSLLTVTFNDTAAGLGFRQRPEPWSIDLKGIVGIEISGCRLDLVGKTVNPPKAVPLEAATPLPGTFMYMQFIRPGNLQIQSGSESDVTVAASSAFSGRALTWSFDADRDIVVFGSEALLTVTPEIHVSPVATDQRAAPLPSRLRITVPSNGLRLSCRTSTAGGIRRSPSLALIAPEATIPLELSVSADVTDPQLAAPRGSVFIGNRTIALGAGLLTMKGDFQLATVRWTPGAVTMQPSLQGQSRDVNMGGEQLVRSTLANWADDPKWTAIAAVLAVILGSMVAKLFDYALPTDKKGG